MLGKRAPTGVGGTNPRQNQTNLGRKSVLQQQQQQQQQLPSSLETHTHTHSCTQINGVTMASGTHMHTTHVLSPCRPHPLSYTLNHPPTTLPTPPRNSTPVSASARQPQTHITPGSSNFSALCKAAAPEGPHQTEEQQQPQGGCEATAASDARCSAQLRAGPSVPAARSSNSTRCRCKQPPQHPHDRVYTARSQQLCTAALRAASTVGARRFFQRPTPAAHHTQTHTRVLTGTANRACACNGDSVTQRSRRNRRVGWRLRQPQMANQHQPTRRWHRSG
jgi:hypothetical protein